MLLLSQVCNCELLFSSSLRSVFLFEFCSSWMSLIREINFVLVISERIRTFLISLLNRNRASKDLCVGIDRFYSLHRFEFLDV